MSNGFTPTTEAGYLKLSNDLKTDLTATMATKCDISATYVSEVGQIAANHLLVINIGQNVKTYGEQVTQWKQEVFFWSGEGPPPETPTNIGPSAPPP